LVPNWEKVDDPPGPRAREVPDTQGAMTDELGAHVSAAGGVQNAPARAREIGSVCLQLFTKQPNRWAEPPLSEEARRGFGAERREHGVRVAGSHDSYLINLASPDPALQGRSQLSFECELARCAALGLDFLVSHPGNATDGDRPSGIARNAESLVRALETVPGSTVVLLELTAGGGHTVGGRFEELAAILAGVPAGLQARVGICVDTCHAWSTGYDLVGDYLGVWTAFDDLLGLDRLRLFHLNDSATPFASRRDRHAHIGEGSLGVEPFRSLLRDERFRDVPKLLETPKDDDPVAADRRNLSLLRSLREG
jgi:deoxyribonuclease-4